MIINFTDVKLKQLPNGNQGLSVSLVENDNSIPVSPAQKQVNIDTANLNEAEMQKVNDFIALCKSKLPA